MLSIPLHMNGLVLSEATSWAVDTTLCYCKQALNTKKNRYYIALVTAFEIITYDNVFARLTHYYARRSVFGFGIRQSFIVVGSTVKQSMAIISQQCHVI